MRILWLYVLTEVCVPVTADRLYYGVGALHTPSHPFAPVGLPVG